MSRLSIYKVEQDELIRLCSFVTNKAAEDCIDEIVGEINPTFEHAIVRCYGRLDFGIDVISADRWDTFVRVTQL